MQLAAVYATRKIPHSIWMPLRTRDVAVLAIAYFLPLNSVVAAPILNFPVNSQVPPVVRVSQHFSFTFAESTFLVSEGSVVYTLLNEPSWLQFDNDTRTLFGNATTNDLGSNMFELVASDDSGSTYHEVTLVVIERDGPQLGNALLPQLSKAGPTSAPASLLLYPLEFFSITFSSDTFSRTTEGTTFYATSADNSPLPSWLQFDATNLRFSGISPPLVSPTAKPQVYGVRLIASDVAGFAEAVATFQTVVGYQILAFSETSQTVELSQGQTFESEPVRKDLTLDGNSIDDAELASVTSNAPTWAELNTQTISLSGTAPHGITNQSVLIEVADIYGDTANTTINLVVFSSQTKLFNTSLAPVNASIGQRFCYTVDPSTLSSNDVQVMADLKNASSWLTYNATSRSFSGFVPDGLAQGPVLIILNARLGSIVEHEQFIVNVVKELASTPSPNTSRALPSSTGYPGANANSTSNDAAREGNRRLVILLAALLPLLVLFSLGILLSYCYWSRRRHRQHSSQASEKHIPRPAVLSSDPEQTSASSFQGIPPVEGTPAPTSPPRIELPWGPDSLRKSRERLSNSVTYRESTLVDSGWGDLVIRAPAGPSRNSGLAEPTIEGTPGVTGDWTPFVRSSSHNLNYSRKRTPFRPTQGRVQRPSISSRASKTLSGLSSPSVGLPVRLSGAGHGAGGPGLSAFQEMRRSWRYTIDSFASEDGRSTPFDLDAFPNPPGRQKGARGEHRKQMANASVRLVPSSSHSGSLEDQRQKWVRDRARDRLERGSRFSHAWSSRFHPKAKELESRVRSPNGAKTGSFETDDGVRHQSIGQSWSQSSSIGVPARPDTLTRIRSPHSHLVRHTSNLRRALSTMSSGRFDSAESKSNSSWIDDLIEEEDKDGRRCWVAVDNSLRENADGENPGSLEGRDPAHGGWGRSSRTGGLGALRANIQGTAPAIPSSERRWRLAGEQAKRPISVDEGELQRSQGSHKGNLAFV